MKIVKTEEIHFTDKNNALIKAGDTILISFKADKPNVLGEFAGFGKRNNTIVIKSNGKDFTLQTKFFDDVLIFNQK